MRTFHTRTAAAAALAALSLLASACASDEPGPSGSGSGGAGTIGSALTDVDAALTYTGGKAGAADQSKKPITIGFIDQNGGTPSFPEEKPAAEAAVQYINNDLGGIGGHPLKLDSCTVSTAEEQGVQCGQQLLNNADVVTVTMGGLALGNQSLYQTLRGAVPVISGNLSLPVDATAQNAIMLDSGILGAGPGLVAYMEQYLHPKTVALVYPNLPQNASAAANTAKILSADGVTVTQASFPPSATDLVAPLLAAQAKDVDVVLPFVNTPTCAPLATALQQIGRTKPVVTLGLCIDPSVRSALGDYPKWTIFFPSENPYMPSNSANVRAFLSAMHRYAGSDANIAGFAGFTFAGVLTVDRILTKIGPDQVSRDAVSQAIKGYSGPGFMLPDTKCGTFPAGPAVCTLSGYVYSYDGGDKWTDPTGGKGIAPHS